MAIQIDPSRDTPPSRQLVEALLERIALGHLAPGARLPSVRALAAEALVNPNTVGKAYRSLEGLGVVHGVNGSGVFVTEEGPKVAQADRRAATLAELEAAIDAALRIGHDPDVLARLLARRAEDPRCTGTSIQGDVS